MAGNPFEDPNFGLDPNRDRERLERQEENPFRDPKFGAPRGIARTAGDFATETAQAGARGFRGLTDLAGAGPNNRASQALSAAEERAQGFLSTNRRIQMLDRSRKIDEAEQSGSKLREAGAYLGAFAEAPVTTTASALATSLPTLGAAYLTRGRGGMAAQAPGMVGAGQMAGIVKGEIYEAVEQAHLQAGTDPEQAAQYASRAQAYDGDNIDQIILAGGLGYIAGSVGIEPIIRRMMGRQAGEHAQRGVLRSAASGAAREAPIEAVQGGQERFASNIAQRREGFDDVPLWEGVVGSGVLEGTAGGAAGGAIGGIEGGVNRRRMRQAQQPGVEPEATDPQADGSNIIPPGAAPEEQLPEQDMPGMAPGAVPDQYRRERVMRERDGFPALVGLPGPPRALPAPPRPSQEMGLDPSDGPISTAATMAVDGGATQTLAAQAEAEQQAEMAQQAAQQAERQQSRQPRRQTQQAETARSQVVDPQTGEVVEDPAQRMALTAERMNYLQGQARNSGGWTQPLVTQRQQVEAAMDSAAGDRWSQMSEAERAQVVEQTDIKGVLRRNVPKNRDWQRINANARDQLTFAMLNPQPAAPVEAAPEPRQETAPEPAPRQAEQPRSESRPPQEPEATAGPRRGEPGIQMSAGEKVLTLSGRETTPFPRIRMDTERKAANTVRAVERWLMDNALEEARARGDEFNARTFEANRDRPSQADKDSAEMYLFEAQPDVVPSITRPLTQPETAPEPAAEPETGQTGQRPDTPPAAETEPTIGEITRKQIPDMTDAELARAIEHYGPEHKRTAKLEREQAKRAGSEPEAEAAPEPTPEPAPQTASKTRKKTRTSAKKQTRPMAEPTDKESLTVEPAPAQAAEYGTQNTIFEQSQWEKDVAALRAKVREIRSGLDPEMAMLGMRIAGYHIEAGTRKFVDVARAMSNDLGVSVSRLRPYLRGWYNGARDMMEDNGRDVSDMDTPDQVRAQLNTLTDETATTETAADEQPTDGPTDPAGAPEVRGGRGDDTQPGSAPDDSADLAPAEPGDGQAPGEAEPGERPGIRSPGEDVASGAELSGGRTASDGRSGTGGTRSPDAGDRTGAGDGPVTDDLFTDDGRPGEPGDGDRADSPTITPVEAANPPPESPAGTGVTARDFHIDDAETIVGGTPVTRFNRNREALELLQDLTVDGRQATPEEQRILAGYTGWGAFGQDLFQGTWERPQYRDQGAWKERNNWLRETLGEQAWKSAQRSITNAHYTDPPTVMAMWDMVRRMGFKGGRVLEPAMGTGNFFSMMPQDLKSRSQLKGIELDETTGRIAQQLFPKSNIHVMGYEKSQTPDGFYDVVIGNWPFENTPIADRRYNKLNPMLHDYFFLKTMDQVRPGGIVIGITSAGSMDKQSTMIRRELAKKAELVTSIRLPSGAFEQYAGTKVVTDIVVLRKRAEPLAVTPTDAGWIESVEVATPSGKPVRVNEYYRDNPNNIIGTLDFGSGTTTFRAGMIVHRPDNMAERLRQAVELVPEGAMQPRQSSEDAGTFYANETGERNGSLGYVDGRLVVAQGDHLIDANQRAKYTIKDAKKLAAREQSLKDLVGLRKKRVALADAERAGRDGKAERQALKKAYDKFVRDHGKLRNSWALKYMERLDDPFFAEVAALEHDDGTPAAVMERSTTRSRKQIKNPSVQDAYVLARNQAVNPSVAAIAELAGKPAEQVKTELIEAGLIYETPAGDTEPTDLYLSGNVREKLLEAEIALEDGNTAMERNIEALKKVVPEDVPYFNIETQMGATWVSPDTYREYIAHMLNLPNTDGIEVSFRSGRWKVKLAKGVADRPEGRANYGTPQYKFRPLVQAAISNQVLKLTSPDADGKPTYDPKKTQEVNERIAKMRADFGQWLWSDPERKVNLEREYNRARNAWATPNYDGSFLAMEGMALSLGDGPFNLRKHQIDAVWRAVVNRRSINAHEVGTGKTFTAAGIAVESRRYGIANKPLLLAHNANSATVAKEARMMYPDARILYVDNLAAAARKIRLRQIANDDWDLIVMPHSLLDNLALSEPTLMQMAADDIRNLEEEVYAALRDDGQDAGPMDLDDEDNIKKMRSTTAKELAKQRKTIVENIKKQAQRASKADAVTFEDLGVDMLLVDEVHEFKKPPIITRMNMKGLNTQSNTSSIALQFLTRYIRQQNNGGNVHTFTGTPITNTITEIYHQMRYVMEQEMEDAGLADWDGWFGSFASEVQDVELTAAGEYEMVTRLAGFVNVPELRKLVGQYMDTVFAENMPEMQPRKTKSGKTMRDELTEAERAELVNGRTENAKDRPYKRVINDSADMTPAQLQEFERLQQYASEWRDATGKTRIEWMRKGDPRSPIVTEQLATKASFDPRLVSGDFVGTEGQPGDDPSSKVSRVVNNVLEIYNTHRLANQVIFADKYYNKTSKRSAGRDADGNKLTETVRVFSPMADLVERLVQSGIPRNEIAVVDGSVKKERRREIAEMMNDGRIRVVIGQTKTLGVGVNMQKNLRAMHHMDAPYMPGELEQRNGRGQRQGNQWNTVLEYRYMTDRLDGRRWQILSIKQRFINAFMKANDQTRIIEGEAAADEQSDILESFSEAAGDPRILQRTKLQRKQENLQNKERMHAQGVYEMRGQAQLQESRAGSFDQRIRAIEASGALEGIPALMAQQREQFQVTIGGQTFDARKEANEAISDWVNENAREEMAPAVIGSYRDHDILISWPKWHQSPVFTLTLFDQTVQSTALQGLETKLRNFPNTVRDMRNDKIQAEQSAQHMAEAAKQPFGQADQLKRVSKQLLDLEKDLEVNPVPPPAWLRQGAPVDSEVYRGRRQFVVTGHRYASDGWYVLAEDDKGSTLIPYMEATDATGVPLYEPREFVPPQVQTRARPDESPDGVAEDRPDYAPYNQDLFGQALPESPRARGRGRGRGRDTQPAAGLRDTPTPVGRYDVRTVVGTETQRKLGADRILDFDDLAQATQYLYRSAVERLDGIVTDANGTPLAVVGGFKGTIDGASVYPLTLVGEAVRVPGAARIWFSHNHPSGVSRLSQADHNIYDKLANALRGSGIEPMGLIAVSGDGYHATNGWSDAIRKPGRELTVPVIEREQMPHDKSQVGIYSSVDSVVVGREFYQEQGGPGLLLLNNKHDLAGWMPISAGMFNDLRGTGQLNTIYRAISESNAAAAVIVHGGELDAIVPSGDGRVTASQNIAAAMQLIDVRALDSVNVDTERTAANEGRPVAMGPVFSRAETAPTITQSVTAENLAQTVSQAIPSLGAAVERMLARGKAGRRGGLVVINSADPAQIARVYARKTGRPYDDTLQMFEDQGQTHGFYDPASGLTFLVGPNLDGATPARVAGIVLHEVYHSDQRQNIDRQAAELLDNRNRQRKPELRALLDRVAARMEAVGETGNVREAAAYIVEQAVSEGRTQGYTSANSRFLTWVRNTFGARVGNLLADFSKMIRQALLRRGLPVRMSVDDLVDYAIASVNQRVNQEGSAQVDTERWSAEDDLQFSRMESITTEALNASKAASKMATGLGRGIRNTTVTDVKRWARGKFTDAMPVTLQGLGRRQIVEIFGGKFLPLENYSTLVDRMQADQTDTAAKADEMARRWGKLSETDQEALADLMHDATLQGIDADPRTEADAGAAASELQARFEAMHADAQAIYREARDSYRAHHKAVLKAIKERVARSEISESRKAEMMKRMEQEFINSVPGVYFPLQRFGNYVIPAYNADGSIASVQRAETSGEADAARRRLLEQFPANQGFRVGKVTLDKEFQPSRDSVGRGFIQELYDAVDEMPMGTSLRAELEDTIGQLYLASFPDVSWAKHGIHRKGTPGYSRDARRAFAHNMFHGGRYLSKLRYSDRMQMELDRIQESANARKDEPDFDQPRAQRVIDEMNKRHEAFMNPKTNPIASALTSTGFVYFLGVSPAAAMVNMSQTPLVAYPMLGARWGFDRAGVELLRASKQAMLGRNTITDSLSAEERRAFDRAVRDGTIDVTQAHDLAGIAQGEDSRVMVAMRPMMRIASFLFHQGEVFNRQVTFMAAYRLARGAGEGSHSAYALAKKATYDSHFDYSQSNRPRITQGNWAKVILLFKQYSQNMVFTLTRNAHQSFAGATPEAKKEAQRIFGGLMGMHFLAAGALGLPLVDPLLWAVTTIANMKSPDEPWDAEADLRNSVADLLGDAFGDVFGRRASEVMFRGVSRLTPADISGRVKLDDLIVPDLREGLDGARLGERLIADWLGPVASMWVLNPLVGLQHLTEGRYKEGMEQIMPVFMQNMVKSYRYHSEGALDRSGVPIREDVSFPGVAAQFVGFAPSEVRRSYEGRYAIYGMDRQLSDRRSTLMRQFAQASMDNDAAGMQRAREAIAKFNQVNPEVRIQANHLMQSVRSRRRRIDESEQGLYLPRNRRGMTEQGRFADY